jgi:integrase/recombinase XerD
MKKKAIQLQNLFTTPELEALMNRESWFNKIELRNKVVISLLIHQGLGASEICDLLLKDVDLDEGMIYARGNKVIASRELNLKPKQILLIQRYIETSRKQLLKEPTNTLILTWNGKAETSDGIGSIIECMKGLYHDRVLSPNTIRQSVISNMLNEQNMALADVQMLAGHKWPSSTERYKRKNIEEQRKKINQWHPLR